MDIYVIGLFCFALGLMAAEIFVPGGISMALGLSLLVAAAARHFMWLPTWTQVAVLWLIIAPVFVIIGMFAAQKLFGGDGDKIPYDEETAAAGQEVEVLSDVYPDKEGGRVRWQGSTWNARSLKEKIVLKTPAVFVRRNNITLIIDTKKTEA